jgi:hypothetical protein
MKLSLPSADPVAFMKNQRISVFVGDDMKPMVGYILNGTTKAVISLHHGYHNINHRPTHNMGRNSNRWVNPIASASANRWDRDSF